MKIYRKNRCVILSCTKGAERIEAPHRKSVQKGHIMGFKMGIVGLPNVGKSTLFNALTKTAAAQPRISVLYN